MAGNYGLQIDIPYVSLTFDKANTKKVMRDAMGEVASAIRRTIRNKAVSSAGNPPGRGKTGDLASKLRASVSVVGDSIIGRVKDKAESIKYKGGERVDGAPYALFLEKGAYGGGGRKGMHNQYTRAGGVYKRVGQASKRVLRARPFMYPVFDSKLSDITARIEYAVEHSIDFEKQKKP